MLKQEIFSLGTSMFVRWRCSEGEKDAAHLQHGDLYKLPEGRNSLSSSAPRAPEYRLMR